MATTIDISSLTMEQRVQLLQALVRGPTGQSSSATTPREIMMSMMRTCAPTVCVSDYETAIRAGNIDYFGSRVIKMTLNGDTTDYRLYDRDAGPGSFMQIFNMLFAKS